MDLEKFGTAGDIQELLAVRDRIDDLIENRVDETATPRADLFDTGDALRLVIEVPGVPQENLEIALQGTDLIVAGLHEGEDEGGEAILRERPSGHFQRTIRLPIEINRESVTAHLEAGLLIVHLPKS